MKTRYITIIVLLLAQMAAAQLSGGGGNNPTCEEEGYEPGATRWFRDSDNDGKGDPNETTCSISQPTGYVDNSQDCDDSDAAWPKQFYYDGDEDGFGVDGLFVWKCQANVTATDSELNTDCDDTNNTIYPNAPELCDGLDNDCDGDIDEGTIAAPSNVTVTQTGCGEVTLSHSGPSTWYWQTAPDGESTADNNANKVVNSGNEIWLRAKSGNCWSDALSVTFSTDPPTIVQPGISGATERCGNGNLTLTPGYVTQNGRTASAFKWYNFSGAEIDETSPGASKTFSLSQANTFFEVAAVVDGCIGPKKGVTLTVHPLPAAPAISVSNACDLTTVSMLNPPLAGSDISWYWQNGTSGTSISDNALSKDFTNAGTVYLRSYNQATGCWGATVQESFSILATPAIPDLQDISITQNCGSVTLSYASNAVPANVEWHWQNAATANTINAGTSATSVQLSNGSSYYIRAKSGTCWSDALSISYTIDSEGLLAPNITSAEQNQNLCGGGSFSYNPSYLVQNGDTPPSHYVWYDANDAQIDELVAGTTFTRTVTVTTTFKVAAKIDGCVGPKTSVTAQVNTAPSALTMAAAVAQITENCNQTIITRNDPPSGEQWYWQSAADGTDTGSQAQSNTIDFTASGTHYLRPRNTSSQCWGDALAISYTVKQSPAAPSTAVNVTQNCGYVTLTRTGVPASGVTWYWQTEEFGQNQDAANANASIDISSGTSRYLRAYEDGCWSGQSLRVDYAIVSGSVVAPTVAAVDRCGAGEIGLSPEYTGLHDPNNPTVTYNFYESDGTTLIENVAFGAVFTATITASTTFQVRAVNNGCEGPATSVIATVNTADTIFYLDQDGDGLGDPFSPSAPDCSAPDGYVSNNNDNCPDINDATNTCAATVDANATHNPDNYIYSRTYQEKRTTQLSNFFTASDAVIQEISYFDGLGRPRQQIAIDQTPDKNDLVTHIGFDGFNRAHREWLPYEATNGALASYRTAAKNDTDSWYEANYGAEMSTAAPNPFAQKHFEPSPLNRVLKQGAPGEAWLVNPNGADNAIEFDYQSNKVAEVERFSVTLTTSGQTFVPSLQHSGTYGAAELTKMVTKDENHVSDKDHTTEEFTDKNGRVVLKRTYDNEIAHDTYYIYDDFGNLTYVLPPAVDLTQPVTPAILADWCYQYVYDHRNRLVEKQLPGKKREYIVYNSLDQVVMTQDANMRSANNASLSSSYWLFTKYDAFGRVAYTGKVNDDRSREAIQNELNAFTSTLWVSDGSFTNGSIAVGYANSAYPSSGITEVLTVNYYDDYGFDTANEPTPPTSVFGEDIDNGVKGLATGSKVRVLGTDDWITSITRYNYQGQVIYSYSENSYLNTTDVVTTKIDFVGRPQKVRSAHSRGATEVVTLDTFTYDHVGRLMTQTQCIGDATLGDSCPTSGGSGNAVAMDPQLTGTLSTDQLATQGITIKPNATLLPTMTLRIDPAANNDVSGQELIVSNTYDALGQLERKDVGGDAAGNGLQTVDYTYNVRGWLQGINDSDPNDNALTLNAADLWGFRIKYNDIADVSKQLFNGNISETLWDSKSINTGNPANPVSKRYTYSYDALNRIKTAVDNTGNYTVNNVAYDKNGNITDLSRMGQLSANQFSNSFGQMDDLVYHYVSGNQLKAVDDTANGNKDYGFIDRAETLDEYGYDDNGNMVRDDNKGITQITYNYLNLPTAVTIDNADHDGIISYIYDATGTKLQKTVAGSVTLYAGNHIYSGTSGNENLQFFNHAEGYVNVESNGYTYVYQYKDHLGNIRLSYTDNNGNLEIVEESNYYPFGLKHRGYRYSGATSLGNDVAQKFKTYQGQEFTDDLGLNTLEWRYRVSDPSIGRFWQVDPLSEDYLYNSVYAFQENKLGLGIELEGAELDRQRGGIKDIMGGTSKALREKTNVHREMDLQGANGDEKAAKAQTDRNKVMSGAMKQTSEGILELEKGVAFSIGEGLDEGGNSVELAALAMAIPSKGSSLALIPIAEWTQIVGKTIKAGVHFSDKNDKKAFQELGEIFIMKAIGKLLQKAIDNTVINAADTKYPITDKEKNIMETTLGTTGEFMEETGNKTLEKSLDNVEEDNK